ncbi:hypothetical protein JAAARDRAFT_34030 [Jaapia argillacea MUCL 33604]|uniref:Uncharacterized protein n=1 Tax=Jaapia argillacea MUCL 33604 TaxID=933084 RepID=A0A067Q9N4_9AGAM|nr:hypothetical protein JAAARDRAFT_34030 [Jaapia argillacea MUCL 33604]
MVWKGRKRDSLTVSETTSYPRGSSYSRSTKCGGLDSACSVRQVETWHGGDNEQGAQYAIAEALDC